MAVESGLLIGGYVEDDHFVGGTLLHNTDWCRRDSAQWLQAYPVATKTNNNNHNMQSARKSEVRLIIGHWTGGTHPVDRIMAGWRGRNSSDTLASAHFVINPAGADAEYAEVWQLADPARTSTYHAPSFNAMSIGVEIVNPGNQPRDPADRAAATETYATQNWILTNQTTVRTGRAAGRTSAHYQFQPAQLKSWRRLVVALTDPDGQAAINSWIDANNADNAVSDNRSLKKNPLRRISVPRTIRIWKDCPQGKCRAVTADWTDEKSNWKGIAEHINNPQTKVDAMGFLMQHLLEMNSEADAPFWTEEEVEIPQKRRAAHG